MIKCKDRHNPSLLLSYFRIFFTSVILFSLASFMALAGDVVIQNGKIDVDSKLYINDVGNVGIGTTNPNDFLHVSGVNPYLNLEGSGVTTVGLKFRVNGAQRWNISLPYSSADLNFRDANSNSVLYLQQIPPQLNLVTVSPQILLFLITHMLLVLKPYNFFQDVELLHQVVPSSWQ